MKLSEIFENYPPSLREKLADIISKAGLTPDLELREFSKKHFEAIAHFMIEEMTFSERKKFYNDLVKHLQRERASLLKILEVKAFPKEVSQAKRKTFEEVYFKVELDEAKQEAARCLKCRVPRCVNACPLNFPVPAYLKAVAEGRIDDACKLALRFMPTQGVCGRICIGYCEKACTLGQIGGEPVRIRAVKRAVADSVRMEKNLPKPKPPSGLRVAIIGSGPAGLTAAYHLRLLGHYVTVFEASEKLGGQLIRSIPEFRLPSRTVEREVELVKILGVEFRTSFMLGRDASIDDLFQQGYKAIFIATGADKPRTLRLKGIELEGVHLGMELLKKVKKGEKPQLTGKVRVIGGGNVAMDVARTALRLGAEEVTIMYRRSREEMPAEEEEIEEAIKEGVEIMFLVQPIELIGEKGELRKVKCIRMRLGEPGPDGRRKPIPVEGSEFEVEADHVIFAIGAKPSVDWLSEKDGIELNEDGTIKVNEKLETSRKGVFAGGDVIRGPSTYAIATADGIKAAREIDRYLRGLSAL